MASRMQAEPEPTPEVVAAPAFTVRSELAFFRWCSVVLGVKRALREAHNYEKEKVAAEYFAGLFDFVEPAGKPLAAHSIQDHVGSSGSSWGGSSSSSSDPSGPASRRNRFTKKRR